MGAHQRRVGIIRWHPLAENVIATAGFDYMVYIWDIAQPDQPKISLEQHQDTITSIEWNFNGSLLVSTCKDKKIRVIDPVKGTVVQEGKGHDGTKHMKGVFVSDENKNVIMTCGFSKMSERQYAIWDAADLSKPLALEM